MFTKTYATDFYLPTGFFNTFYYGFVIHTNSDIEMPYGSVFMDQICGCLYGFVRANNSK